MVGPSALAKNQSTPDKHLVPGTEVLRRGLNPKEAPKAFILDMADNRTIDLVCTARK